MEMLILGFALGLIAGPVLRSWIVWREYRDASRQARLADETLRRLERGAYLPSPETDWMHRDNRHSGDR